MENIQKPSGGSRKPMPPGELLRQVILQRCLSQEGLAHLLGVSLLAVSSVIRGRMRISPNLALRLSALLEMPIGIWLDAQMRDDVWRLENRLPVAEAVLNISSLDAASPSQGMALGGTLPKPAESLLRDVISLTTLLKEQKLVTRRAIVRQILLPIVSVWMARTSDDVKTMRLKELSLALRRESFAISDRSRKELHRLLDSFTHLYLDQPETVLSAVLILVDKHR